MAYLSLKKEHEKTTVAASQQIK